MEALLGGFATTLSLDNLFYCFVGAFLGTAPELRLGWKRPVDGDPRPAT